MFLRLPYFWTVSLNMLHPLQVGEYVELQLAP